MYIINNTEKITSFFAEILHKDSGPKKMLKKLKDIRGLKISFGRMFTISLFNKKTYIQLSFCLYNRKLIPPPIVKKQISLDSPLKVKFDETKDGKKEHASKKGTKNHLDNWTFVGKDEKEFLKK